MSSNSNKIQELAKRKGLPTEEGLITAIINQTAEFLGEKLLESFVEYWPEEKAMKFFGFSDSRSFRMAMEQRGVPLKKIGSVYFVNPSDINKMLKKEPSSYQKKREKRQHSKSTGE